MRAKRNTEPCPPHSMCAEFGDRGGLGVAERASRDRLRSAALSVVAVMALLLASCGTSVDDSRSDRTATTQASITVGTIPAATPTTVVGAKPESPGNGISGGAADSSEPPTVDEPTTSAADSAGQQDDQSGEPVEESAEQDISEPAEGDEPQADDSSVGAAETSSVARILSLLDALDVTAETSGGYDRALFKHWVDADGDGCDARREVLIAEAVAAPSVGARCSLSGGEWLSRYDGKTASGNGSSFDVDHMVPLAEAWESGARNWTEDRREAYANDLGYADSLIAVSASSNRSKGARDPAEWLPPAQGVHCWYTAAWVQVKTRWDLASTRPKPTRSATSSPAATTTTSAACPKCRPSLMELRRRKPTPSLSPSTTATLPTNRACPTDPATHSTAGTSHRNRNPSTSKKSA
ncbi:GmrSD restriction endonuclease domain-containing protein [Candidatus Poriferisodalis sp.]|uniref:HNH endonuclease family protein n=1 Tax=Candidatus Poriferisodalis sp. TaxID=3101277 RepID=UPI003B528155